MKTRLLFVCMLLTLGCKEQAKQNTAGLLPEVSGNTQEALLDTYLRALTDMGRFNGVLFAEKGDQVLLYKAFNTEVYDLSSLKVTPDSQFDIRSVAKLFAKATLLEQQREGTLNLNQAADDFIPGLPWGKKVTLKHLMDHTSGLPRELSRMNDRGLSLDREQVIGLIRQEALEFEPGTDTLYSNPGFQLLYKIIGQVEGSTFPGVLHERFLDPLEMTGTGGHFYDPAARLDHYAYGHYLKNDTLVSITDLEDEDMRMGHLFSTAADLGRFLEYLMTSEIAGELAQDGVITHAGGSRGKRAWVYASLPRDYKIIFLSNIDMIPFEQLTKDLVRIMEGESVEIPKAVHRKAVPIAPELLHKYAGTYDFVDAGHLVLEFRVENDSLVAWQKGQRAGTLIPESDSVFFWDPKSAESVLFKTDDTGELKAYMDFQGVRWEGTKMKEER